MTDVVGASPFRDVCRISLAGFEHILESANPAVLRERSAGEYYATILGYHLDPLFLVAKFNHESSLGKAGVAVTTHSWGNTRAPNFGATPIGMTPGRTGTFPIWKDWLDGLKSTCARLTTHEWVYFGRDEIEEIYDDPSGDVWAPAGDLNDPHGYLSAMLRFMNEHQDVEEEQPVGFNPIIPGNTIYGVPFRVSIIPANNVNRKKLSMYRYDGPLIHETANPNVGANAEMHRRFTHNGGGAEEVAFTFTVDDHEIIQLLPLNEGAWHAGNETCNHTRWGIELCVNADGDFHKTMQNAAKLVAFLWSYVPESNGKVKQHHDCSGKNCPMTIRNTNQWDAFLSMVQAVPHVPVPPAVPGGTTVETINGMKVLGGILAFYNANGRERIIGVPLNEEHAFTAEDGKKVRRQDFDKLGLEWADGMSPDSFDVRVANSNAESLRLRTLLNEDDAYAAIQQIKLLVKDIA